jgi:hypothetical protein
VLSTAVDSRQLGPQIFLSLAAKEVLALIHSGHAPLGGYPTETVAGGDFAPVTTEQGTYVYVPPGLPGRAAVAMPYVQRGPSVAAAWLGAMRELNAWLWPLPPLADGGSERFRFVRRRGESRATATVIYDPASGTARRGAYVYTQPQLAQLDEEAPQRMAELAR